MEFAAECAEVETKRLQDGRRRAGRAYGSHSRVVGPPLLLHLQRVAGNRAVQGFLASDGGSPTAIKTRTVSWPLTATIPAVSRDTEGPSANAVPPLEQTIDGVPEVVDQTEDPEIDMHCEGDTVSGALNYSPTVTHPATPPPPGDFGQTNGNHIHPNFKEFRYSSSKKQYTVRVDYENDIQVLVCSDKGPRGQTDIESPNDSDITKLNYGKVANDLTPDLSNQGGTPPRTKFWARDLTLVHEDFHATDGQRFCQKAVADAQTDLNAQTLPAPSDPKFKELNDLMRPIPGKIVQARGAGMASGGEQRAYQAGAAAYQARADAIRAAGKAGQYPQPTTPGGGVQP